MIRLLTGCLIMSSTIIACKIVENKTDYKWRTTLVKRDCGEWISDDQGNLHFSWKVKECENVKDSSSLDEDIKLPEVENSDEMKSFATNDFSKK